MPKAKTRKTVAKRIHISKKGRLKRFHVETSHLRAKESSRTRHRKSGLTELSASDVKRVRRQLPYI